MNKNRTNNNVTYNYFIITMKFKGTYSRRWWYGIKGKGSNNLQWHDVDITCHV